MSDWREEARKILVGTAVPRARSAAARLGHQTYQSAKPLTSESAAVHSTQVAEMNQFIKDHGITGATHSPDGRVHFTSRRARKRYLRARGMADLDGSYGD